MAPTLNLTVPPGTALWLAGWLVMTGAWLAGKTARIALELVMLPAALLTTTE